MIHQGNTQSMLKESLTELAAHVGRSVPQPASFYTSAPTSSFQLASPWLHCAALEQAPGRCKLPRRGLLSLNLMYFL